MEDYNKIKIIISDIDGVWTDGSAVSYTHLRAHET